MSAARGNMCTHEEAAKFSPRGNNCEVASPSYPYSIHHTPTYSPYSLQMTGFCP